MITLTTEATDVIREMVGNAELPDTGGLRLDMSDGTLNSAPPSLALTLVETPATGDEVIDEGDVHVYVSRAGRAAARRQGARRPHRGRRRHLPRERQVEQPGPGPVRGLAPTGSGDYGASSSDSASSVATSATRRSRPEVRTPSSSMIVQ